MGFFWGGGGGADPLPFPEFIRLPPPISSLSPILTFFLSILFLVSFLFLLSLVTSGFRPFLFVSEIQEVTAKNWLVSS